MDRKTSGRFSWADEVEKEEEEEEEEKAQAHLLHQQNPTKRPNPFGSARPREIVLQERGIDWRNLDHQLQSSNLRKERNQSKPIPLAVASIEREDQFSVINRGFEQNNRQIQNLRSSHEHIVPLPAFLYQQKENSIPSIPPLQYPPKNLLYVMGEMQRFHNSKSIGRSKLQHERHLGELDLEEENSITPEAQMWNHNNIETIKTSNHGGEKENVELRYGRNHVEKRLIGPPPVEHLPNGGGWVDLYGKMENTYFQENIRDRRVQSAGKGSDRRNSECEFTRRQVNFNGKMDRQGVQSARRRGDGKNAELKLGRRGNFDSNAKGADFGGNYERGRRSIIEKSYWNMECELMNSPMQERVPYNLNQESRGFEESFGRRGGSRGHFDSPMQERVPYHLNQESRGFQESFGRRGGSRGHFDSNSEGANFGGNYEGGIRPVIEGQWDTECELMNNAMQERVPYNLNLESRGFGEDSRKRRMASTSEIVNYNQRRRYNTSKSLVE